MRVWEEETLLSLRSEGSLTFLSYRKSNSLDDLFFYQSVVNFMFLWLIFFFFYVSVVLFQSFFLVSKDPSLDKTSQCVECP